MLQNLFNRVLISVGFPVFAFHLSSSCFGVSAFASPRRMGLPISSWLPKSLGICGAESGDRRNGSGKGTKSVVVGIGHNARGLPSAVESKKTKPKQPNPHSHSTTHPTPNPPTCCNTARVSSRDKVSMSSSVPLLKKRSRT